MSFANESCGISKHCPFTLGLSNVSCKRTVFLFLISVKLCEDFCVIMKCTEVGPVPTLLVSFLQQGVASTGTSVGPLSTYLPEDLVGKILVMIRHFRFFMWNVFAFSRSRKYWSYPPVCKVHLMSFLACVTSKPPREDNCVPKRFVTAYETIQQDEFACLVVV